MRHLHDPWIYQRPRAWAKRRTGAAMPMLTIGLCPKSSAKVTVSSRMMNNCWINDPSKSLCSSMGEDKDYIGYRTGTEDWAQRSTSEKISGPTWLAPFCLASHDKGICIAALSFLCDVKHFAGSLRSQSWNPCPMLTFTFWLLTTPGPWTPSLISAVIFWQQFLRLSGMAFGPYFCHLLYILWVTRPFL